MTSLGIGVTRRGLVEVPVLNRRQNEHCVFGPQPGGGRFYMLLTLEDSSHPPPPLVHFPCLPQPLVGRGTAGGLWSFVFHTEHWGHFADTLIKDDFSQKAAWHSQGKYSHN